MDTYISAGNSPAQSDEPSSPHPSDQQQEHTAPNTSTRRHSATPTPTSEQDVNGEIGHVQSNVDAILPEPRPRTGVRTPVDCNKRLALTAQTLCIISSVFILLLLFFATIREVCLWTLLLLRSTPSAGPVQYNNFNASHMVIKVGNVWHGTTTGPFVVVNDTKVTPDWEKRSTDDEKESTDSPFTNMLLLDAETKSAAVEERSYQSEPTETPVSDWVLRINTQAPNPFRQFIQAQKQSLVRLEGGVSRYPIHRIPPSKPTWTRWIAQLLPSRGSSSKHFSRYDVGMLRLELLETTLDNLSKGMKAYIDGCKSAEVFGEEPLTSLDITKDFCDWLLNTHEETWMRDTIDPRITSLKTKIGFLREWLVSAGRDQIDLGPATMVRYFDQRMMSLVYDLKAHTDTSMMSYPSKV